ncbi:putative sodium bile acid cotransporter [Protomyces lactucae-debilis]|uniref:Putative sodium bile acid cotransporter n=1 Tax=Protomyces lactucae-debilis TaxID=2754530 RepID=A0A1Y2ERF5_PROLT|nr:putative sodium bile acid cotransporter [Protomyces lactucae-debilis]ORY74128.1 putative sodium bile acid cotransporter [Protomyces lactucae-debilis]
MEEGKQSAADALTRTASESTLTVPAPVPKKQVPLWRRIWDDSWFLCGFALVIVVGHLAPNVARRGGVLRTEYTFSYGALALIFLISGLTMPTALLFANLKRIRLHVITQSMSFLIAPAIALAIVQCIRASGTTQIPTLVLAGFMIMICTPTTVASNVTFTRASGGDDAAALIEVTIGNLFGIFISPALVQLFLRDSLGLGIAKPKGDVTQLYLELIKHFGLALYLPLVVGQVIQNIYPGPVKKVSNALRLTKWASVCLLLLCWMSFSDAFYHGAFKALPAASLITIVFVNLGLYPFLTLICFLACRPPYLRKWHLDRRATTAVCFCGPPKSITVGIVLLQVQFAGFSPIEQAIFTIPLSLYQGQQLALAQVFVLAFRRWNRGADKDKKGSRVTSM